MKKTTSISFNKAMSKMAVSNLDRTISLYDKDFNRKEKMPTRGADKTDKNYIIQTTAFSPDSTILAVAQSDNIIYSYKVGVTFGEKKSICSKIILSSAPSCIEWPSDRLFEFFFGDISGNVQLAKIKNHKAEVLYETKSSVLNVFLSQCGKYLVSSHLDKSIYVFTLSTKRKKLLTTALTVPSSLGVGKHIGSLLICSFRGK
jgi:intraflagellar transport protein 172